MTEEPNKQEQDQQLKPEKLLLDDPSNFQMHAAYLVYSDLFDNNADDGVRKELNSNIEALKQGQINPETFYRNIAPHRKMSLPPRPERFSLQTQRKKDWRAKEQKQERIRRHKK